MRKKNKKIAIPGDQAVQIERYINMYEGYKSVPEFVREAVKEHLKEKKVENAKVTTIPKNRTHIRKEVEKKKTIG